MKRKVNEDDNNGGTVASSPTSLVASSPPSVPATTKQYGRGKILLLGDSLTQLCFDPSQGNDDGGSGSGSGWGSALAHQYQRRADVLNRGMSGYNSWWYLKYAAEDGDEGEMSASHIWTEPGNVLLITIFFGANDAALPDQGSARLHVALDDYRMNLMKLIDLANRSYPNAKIIVITPPPVYGPQRLAWQKKRYGDQATGIVERTTEHTQHYAAMCNEVAQRFLKNVACMDLFTAMLESNKKNTNDTATIGAYFYDGLHFSPAGHDFVYQLLLATIAKHFPELVVTPCPVTEQPNNSGSVCTGIPNNGPHHDEIGTDHRYTECASMIEECNDRARYDGYMGY
mmetsp:Transcript_49921/g.53889  ORF Transcript_49921/g.53889 Transcript_49921/m.53889 type:complete len:342 (+) Transcript_49921:105-1130(+)